MAYVYILKSEKNGSYYIGSTSNMDERLKRHNSGQVTATKNLRPFLVSFFREYPTSTEARIIESKLKRLKSRVIIDRIISDGEIRLSSVG